MVSLFASSSRIGVPQQSTYTPPADDLTLLEQVVADRLAGEADIFSKHVPDAREIDVIEALNTFEAGDILTEFLRGQQAPGGFLSPGQGQKEFGVQARGILDGLGDSRRRLEGDLRGLNPAFSSRARSTLDFQALEDLLAVRTGAVARSSERNFQGELGLANTLAAQDNAEKQGRLQALQFATNQNISIENARRGAKSATVGGLTAGLGNIASGALQGAGAAGGFGALFSGI